MKHWDKNGLKKIKNSQKMISKMKSIEPQLKCHGITNTKEWTKINLFGWEVKARSLKNNTNNSIKMSSRILVIHWHGLILKPKAMLILQDYFIFQKELPMTNSKNSMKKRIKLNYLSEESLLMINFKIFYQNISTLLRLLLIQIIYH
jgi:hypothetical protein